YCQQIDEMHRKLQQQSALVSRKGPILQNDNTRANDEEAALQKFNQLDYDISSQPLYSSGLSPTGYHFFKHLVSFLGEKCFTNHDDAKNIFNKLFASRTPELYAVGIDKLVSDWK
ncbi:hypothetical protein Angca_006138, partial [Angiostrongylus cantonensis]